MTTQEQFALLDQIDLSLIPDEQTRQGFLLLLNLVENLAQENRDLRAEIARLRDEINRLKGEQGAPPRRPAPAGEPPRPLSSEEERHTPQPHAKRPKLARIQVDREEVLHVDPATLPADAEFKGYEDVVVQDIILRTDNVRFRKEVFYSPSAGRSYRAALPPGYNGEFGPSLKALCLVLYYGGLMSEPKIGELLANVGVAISAGSLSNILIHDQEAFHAEKDAVYEAGLRSSPWQQSDDTATAVDGEPEHCHIVSNLLYTVYQTRPAKDRLTIIDVLRNGQERAFVCNEAALACLARLGLSGKVRAQLRKLPRDKLLSEAELEDWLGQEVPALGEVQKRWIKDSLAIAAYQGQEEWPVVKLLLTDDAPQFGLVTEEHALCWVHEGRHYKKLVPRLAVHRRALAEFLREFWAYYHKLRAYQEAPEAAVRAALEAEFDELFSRQTGYGALDERIALTRGKKAELLVVLAHPEVPLHNNAAELGARGRVRKRDVSFGPRTAAGAKAWDTFQSLGATAKKLGISFYAYIQDRVRQTNALPALADLIAERAKEGNLGASWPTS